MKLWCDCCDKVQPVEVTDERCAKTYAAYQDIICTECRLVIASGNDIRRTWVGLTDDEKQQCIYDEQGFVLDYEDCVDVVEAKLKEKNT